MARPLRIEYPGAFYHVMARGDDRRAIFWDDELGGRRPGQVTDLYMYDSDLKKFASIGTGTVSADGTSIASDSGIKKAGYLFAGADIVIADLLKTNATAQKLGVWSTQLTNSNGKE